MQLLNSAVVQMQSDVQVKSDKRLGEKTYRGHLDSENIREKY